MYLFCVYIPETHLETVKKAIFEAGAGKIGNYDSCCWQVKGQGQFRPLPGSTPFLGREGGIETVSEYRIEVVVADEFMANVVKAMKVSHPYEEPAYYVVKTENF